MPSGALSYLHVNGIKGGQNLCHFISSLGSKRAVDLFKHLFISISSKFLLLPLFSTNVTLNFDVKGQEQLATLADQVFELVMEAKAEFVSSFETQSHVWLEEGSLRIRSKILIAGTSLYLGIVHVGSFIDGIEAIAALSKQAAEYIAKRVPQITSFRDTKVISSRVNAGVTDRLKHILQSVRDGELSPEDAEQRIFRIFERSGEIMPPIFRQDLRRSISEIPVKGWPQEQQTMNIKLPAISAPSHLLGDLPHRQPRKPSIRVEVWEDSEEGRKRRFY
jgi:hypothetical protein